MGQDGSGKSGDSDPIMVGTTSVIFIFDIEFYFFTVWDLLILSN